MLSRDTSSEIEQRQIERWRAMTPTEKMHLVGAASQAAREMALAGLRVRHPHAEAREIFLRYAILTLGPDNAARLYPEAGGLLPSK